MESIPFVNKQNGLFSIFEVGEMTLTERVDNLAKEKGMTFASIERALGFGQGSIRRWDSSLPSCDKLYRVAGLLSTTMDYLLLGEEPAYEGSLSDEALDIARKWDMLDYDDRVIIKGEVYKAYKEAQQRQFDVEAKSS